MKASQNLYTNCVGIVIKRCFVENIQLLFIGLNQIMNQYHDRKVKEKDSLSFKSFSSAPLVRGLLPFEGGCWPRSISLHMEGVQLGFWE